MWSRLALCLLVGVVYARTGGDNVAWHQESKYVYEIRARSLVSLDQLSNEYSGFFLKAVMEIIPSADGNLNAKIVQPQYAPIQGPLRERWNQYIPDSELPFKQLQLSPEPFIIEFKEGIIRNIIVSNNINNWEANIIKSFVSQFQLDTQAQNVIPSPINVIPSVSFDTAAYKTMEETVTGVSETLYELHQISRLFMIDEPWTINERYVSPHDNIIQITKTKNFTNSELAPSYHFGLDGLQHYEPSNKVGNFLSRTAVTTAVVTGNLNYYTIHNSVTLEEIYVSLALTGNQKGSVHNLVNVTLQQIIPQTEQTTINVTSPVKVGVVYGFNSPFAEQNNPRSVSPRVHVSRVSSEVSSEENQNERNRIVKRSVQPSNKMFLLNSLESLRNSDNPDYFQPQPDLQNAPSTPLLPFFVGYNGQSINKQQNIVDTVCKLAQTIGQEYEDSSQILKENTIGEFVLLSSLARVMNVEEIQQVSSRLFTKERTGIEAAAWLAFYSSVAQAGTAPAIRSLFEWIKNDRIVELEAAEAITVALDSARTPTLEFVKMIFQNLKDQKLIQQKSLNESLMLSFSSLVHEVYINQEVSHNKHPVHSFGSFYTAEGREFVIKEVLPWYVQQLTQAFDRDDTQNIHLYIRALGNVGDQHILEAFEPYLENQKPASVVQRVHMILALDHMIKTNPVEVRAVTFKIAENLAEDEEVRVAAVYQLMRTNPSPVMLQRVALNTRVDSAQYVNAATKSAIETASELQGSENAALREAAQSARPQLINREYGLQYSQVYLRSFVSKMYEQESYKQTILLFGGQDAVVSKGLLYTLRANYGGIRQRLGTLQSLVSSVEDLVTAFQQRTQTYQEQVNQKEQANPEQHPWTSEYVAKILQMQIQPREQLESYLYFKMSAMQKLLSFNNQTIDELVQIAQQWQTDLNEGEVYQYRSMKIVKEVAIAVPTVLGLPFMYTFDVPLFVKAQADIQATANPEIIQGDTLQRPDSLNVKFEINALVSARIQTQITLFTPFDSQRYTAGFNKNLQFEVPLKGDIDLNLQNRQLKTSIENPAQRQSTQLVHYSNVPYTAKNPIFASKPERKIIKSDEINRLFYQFGRESTGIAVDVEVNSEQIINLPYIWEKLSRYDLVTDMLGSWISTNMQFTSIDVTISSSKSFTEKVVLEMGYETQYKSEKHGSLPTSIKDLPNKIPPFETDSQKRQLQFISKVSEGIANVESVAADANVQFLGQRKLKYQITMALGRSNIDPMGRFMALAQRINQDEQLVQAYVTSVARFPNTNGLDLDFAMKMNPESYIDTLALIERNQQLSRIEAKLQLNKTMQRVQYLENRPEYKKYQKHPDMALPIVARMIAQANFLNKLNLSVKYDNLDPLISKTFYRFYSLIRQYLYPRIFENLFIDRNEKTVKAQVEISPDLRFANTSLVSDFAKIEIYNLALSEWAQKVLVPHPVFHLRSRVFGYINKFDIYRPICALNSYIVTTFDNRTYTPVFENNAKTVLLQYVPRRSSNAESQSLAQPLLQSQQSANEQLQQLVDSYVVYVRPNAQNNKQKDVQLVFISPESQSKIVEVSIVSTGADIPKVLVNNEEVQVSEQQATDFYDDLVQVYALPNNEVKVEVRGIFYIISDGETVKITATSSKLRDASRGLCGTFTGESSSDFLTPSNTITQDEDEFVTSYTISAENLNPRKYLRKTQSKRRHFGKDISQRPNYITERDIGSDSKSNKKNSCVKLQTRFVEEGDRICFTLHPMASCKSSCRSSGSITNKVPVHCVRKQSSSGILWKNEILKGASPDLSQESRSLSIPMSSPRRCFA